jgi:hypothetical protein
MRCVALFGSTGILGLSLSLALAEPSQPPWLLAALAIGDKRDLAAMPDEMEPKPQLKRDASGFPTVDTTRKGDPYIGLRPSLEGRLLLR